MFSPRLEVLLVGRYHNVAVRLGDIAIRSPEPCHFSNFDLRLLVRAVEPRRQEPSQPRLHLEIRLQPGLREQWRLLTRAGQRIEHRPDEKLKRHHGRNRIAGQTEERSCLVRASQLSENQRLARLNQHAGEEELCSQLRQRLLHQIVLAHRHAAAQQQQVGLRPFANEHFQLGGIVARHRQDQRVSSSFVNLRRQRVAIGIANFVRAGNKVDVDQLVAGGQNCDSGAGDKQRPRLDQRPRRSQPPHG